MKPRAQNETKNFPFFPDFLFFVGRRNYVAHETIDKYTIKPLSINWCCTQKSLVFSYDNSDLKDKRNMETDG